MSLTGKTAQPKNVVIIGWLGAFNLGDEMMLDVTMGFMKEYGHNVTLLTHKDDKEVRQRYHEAARVISKGHLSEEILQEVVENNDILFVNGGALVDDRYYDEPECLTRDIARLARGFIDNDKKVIIYGISTNNNLEHKRFKDDYKYIIDNAEHVSVRDEFSESELAKFSDRKIDIVDDIVFADKLIAIPQDELDGDHSMIGVTLVLEDDAMDDIKQFIANLIDNTDRPIRFISFYDEDDKDARKIDEIRNYLGDKKKYRIRESLVPKNSVELYDSLRDVGLYISMRYHGVLYAGALGKEVVCLNYDKHPHYYNKNKYLAETYDMNISKSDLSSTRHMNGDTFRSSILEKDSGKWSSVSIRKVHRRAFKNIRKIIRSI